MSDTSEQIFEPDVKISEKALARRRRFEEEKLKARLAEEDSEGYVGTGYQPIQPTFEEKVPRVWFDTQGEIVAFGYDDSFSDIQDDWKTHDFDEKLLGMIKFQNPNRFFVQETRDEDGTFHYHIKSKQNRHRSLSHQSGLVHAAKLTGFLDELVDVTVEIKNDKINVKLTDAGKDHITKDSKVYLKNDHLQIHITAPKNPHILLHSYDIDINTLITEDFVADAEGFAFKSVYGTSPFRYGRL
jgi:hypothetical protein